MMTSEEALATALRLHPHSTDHDYDRCDVSCGIIRALPDGWSLLYQKPGAVRVSETVAEQRARMLAQHVDVLCDTIEDMMTGLRIAGIKQTASGQDVVMTALGNARAVLDFIEAEDELDDG